jgi:putative heme iron utilization protein
LHGGIRHNGPTMDADTLDLLDTLLRRQPVAALATLHRGEPAASMVPWAVLPDGSAVVLHVSRLATHTADLLAHPNVGLLVVAPADLSDTPLALPRWSLQGEALPCSPTDADFEAARTAFQTRFPDSVPMFDFGDFTLVRIRPESARFVAGFGRAHALVDVALQAALARAAQPSA